MEEQKASLFLISQVCVQTHADNYLYSSFKLLFFSKIQTKQISLSMTCWLCTTVFFFIQSMDLKLKERTVLLISHLISNKFRLISKRLKSTLQIFSMYIYVYKPSCLLSVNKNSIKQFTWAAMTCCLWTTSRQLPQTQSFHGQFFLWPLKTLITPWFLHLAHLGVLSLFFSTTFGIYGQWWLQVLKVF